MPGRAKDGLFVLRDEVAMNEQINKVSVTPKLGQFQVEMTAVRFDYLRPLLSIFRYFNLRFRS